MSATACWTSSSSGVLELVAAFARQYFSGFDSAYVGATSAISTRAIEAAIAAPITREAKSPMKFFPNPEKAAEKKFADTRASRDALAVRLTAAQDAVASAHATLHQLAVEGAVDAALADGEAKLRDTERRVATLTPALVEIDKLLATLEAERAEMLDKKTRAATALATNALA